MHALIVVAHPHSQSLTHAIATHIAQGIQANSSGNTYEIADLAAESFDPRFTEYDWKAFLGGVTQSHEIVAEQTRLSRADALVLVYPIYWWSFPALLKGWIDRVFTQGWAYEDDGSGKVVKKLQHLPVHLVANGGANQRTFARHGYFGAMKTQIEQGIFGYCGAPVVTSELLLASDLEFPSAHLETAQKIGRRIFSDSPDTIQSEYQYNNAHGE